MIPQPTIDQTRALHDDLAAHHSWLASKGIEVPIWPEKSEKQYTGLLLAALLDPDASATVCHALLDGGLDKATAPVVGHPTTVYAPDKGPDITLRLTDRATDLLLVVEHKRFRSPSHAPGYKKHHQTAAWQTDQTIEAAGWDDPPLWLSLTGAPSAAKKFIVFDAHGMNMEQLFPGGEYNDDWSVTSYRTFSAELRRAFEGGVRGLVPLLAALYAGYRPPRRSRR